LPHTKATLNTGNDHSICLYILQMVTVENQLQIAKLRPIYLKLSKTENFAMRWLFIFTKFYCFSTVITIRDNKRGQHIASIDYRLITYRSHPFTRIHTCTHVL